MRLACTVALALLIAPPLHALSTSPHADPPTTQRTARGGEAATDGGDRDPDRVPSLRTSRVTTAPTIDGRLGDAVWDGAEVARGFTQLRPEPGRPASQRTEVRVLYDDEAVYVAARMYDTAPDSVVAQLGRRDSGVYSDWIYVAIDSYHDRRTAFVFGLNPRGVMQDVLLHSDVEDDDSWDAVWDGAAVQDAEGWTAEFRIPLSQLRFSAPEHCARGGRGSGGPGGSCGDAVWGVNFMREIARYGEESYWAPTLPDEGRVVSVFGELHGLDGLEPPRRLEIMPYAVASATAAPGDVEDPFHRDMDPFGGIGADLKAGITSDLTLTATLNPDFGQVEADPSVVNLTAFETFFPEKRPFFVEGVDIFRFGIGIGDGDLGNESLFYSRRIGRRPQGDLDGDYTDAPDATTILGATKLSGKTSGGWSIGVLDAVTAAEHGQFVEDDVRGDEVIEPLTNYGVVRVMKDFRAGQSAVGGIFTATNRSLPGSGELDWLNASAYTGGLDFRHRFGGDTYQLSGSVVASRVAGSADAIDEIQTSPVHYLQRPDADHLEYDPSRTSMSGFAAKTELGKLQGDWRFMLFGMTISPEFEANDLGFQTNADWAFGGFWTGYRQDEPGRFFRRWNIGSNGWTGSTYGGERVALGGNVNGGFQLKNFWGGHLGVNFAGEEYSTSMLRGGPAFLRPANLNFWSYFYSDERKPVSLGLSLNASDRAEGAGESLRVGPSVSIRPSDNADLYLGPSISWNRNTLQYVETAELEGRDHWLLGTVDQTTVSLTARLNYTFSPTLSLQLYAQPFISAGEYSEFKQVTDPRASSLDGRVRGFADGALYSTVDEDDDVVYHADLDADGSPDFDFDDPSFNFKELRSNVVLRWEYRPGSALFLVWSQGRSQYAQDGRFRLGDDVSSLWSAEGTNVLLVKVSYWLGL